MKLIKPSVEIWDQEEGLNGIYKSIERAGRICYKSSDKITEDSAKLFVDKMINLKHYSMLEHGTVYLRQDISIEELASQIAQGNSNPELLDIYGKNPYSTVYGGRLFDEDTFSILVTTNYRVIIEHNRINDLKYLCEPTEFHEKRVTVHFICDRGILAEYTRHRVFSFAAESTRYCNYSKDKFGNEVTFIEPCWLNIPEGKYTNISKQSPEDGEYKQIMLHENNVNAYPVTTTPEGRFLWGCFWSEHDYFDLIGQGWKPQQARAVLPNALKTELVMTGFISDWKHFIDLRYRGTTGKPHPDAFYLAEKLYNLFKEKGIDV